MNANADRPEARGLCMTCNYAESCIYLARASSPVWRCEEFDDRPPVTAPEDLVVMARVDPMSGFKSVETDSTELQNTKE